MLSMGFHSDLLAHLQHRACGTMRKSSGTNMFPKGNQQSIDVDPITLWKFFLQGKHGFFWRGCLYVAPTIRNAVDMNIDADKWLTAGNTHYEMGTFGTHPCKGEQRLFVTG